MKKICAREGCNIEFETIGNRKFHNEDCKEKHNTIHYKWRKNNAKKEWMKNNSKRISEYNKKFMALNKNLNKGNENE